ncbi:MAG TPA: hypothetical protein VGM17_15565, partial [Rhizomicrobium sp.]
MFYIASMERESISSPLHEHVWGQLKLLQECQHRAEAARDWRACAAWTATFVRVSNAMTETAKVLARAEQAAALSAHALAALALPLPKLPHLPREGGVPPSQNPKTTSEGISNKINANVPSNHPLPLREG